ncbi:hypothetical protein Droror1_Dr00022445 [Drosera rotundifolia]
MTLGARMEKTMKLGDECENEDSAVCGEEESLRAVCGEDEACGPGCVRDNLNPCFMEIGWLAVGVSFGVPFAFPPTLSLLLLQIPPLAATNAAATAASTSARLKTSPSPPSLFRRHASIQFSISKP